MRGLAITTTLILSLVLALPAFADWDPGDPAKWVQPLDTSTAGLFVTSDNGIYGSLLADDFLCTETGWITGLHMWGAPIMGHGPAAIRVTFHDDIPAAQSPTGYSMPGDTLWMRMFTVSDSVFTVRPCTAGVWYWWEPPDFYRPDMDLEVNQYNISFDPFDAFMQLGTQEEPVVYWVSIQPIGFDFEFAQGASSDHWNDDAVYVEGGQEPYVGIWQELRYPIDHPNEGQSVDLAFVVESVPSEGIDYGDAPDPTYPTLAASNGASHVIIPGFSLGPEADGEADGQPVPGGLGDDYDGNDDEHGVFFTTPLVPNQEATVEVELTSPTGTGLLDAWIDFDGDGDWDDAHDQIFASETLTSGVNVLNFNVPHTSGQQLTTYARFRLSSTGGLTPYGHVNDGEVEDHKVIVRQNLTAKWVQLPDLSPLGMDVLCQANTPLADVTLGDDFNCTETGPILDINIWGSWKFDDLPSGGPGAIDFTLSIHEDRPAGSGGIPYSRPGPTLWTIDRPEGTFDVQVWENGLDEGWYDPDMGIYFSSADTACYLYSFHFDEAEAFVQTGTENEPVIYWLVLEADPSGVVEEFGWKTSIDHWNDNAVFRTIFDPWDELYYPNQHPYHGQPIDLAFTIESEINTGVQDSGEMHDGVGFGLHPNVPNPFNPATTISYEVPAGAGNVTVQVFDVSGRLVASLVDGHQTPGQHSVVWRGTDDAGKDVSSGIYFCRMTVGEIQDIRKMVLLK
jgi:hypothetical protein